MNQWNVKRSLWILLWISFTIRIIIAAFIELGNDEVYYVEYARFPAISHFDHPPLVGFLIQLFTFNLSFSSELFIRLGAVIGGTISTYLLFLIGRELKDEKTGFISALLFQGSIYGFIITGTFIMPDSSLLPLWLGSVFLLIKLLTNPSNKSYWLLLGLCSGLAIYSKYHAVFIWIGIIGFSLIWNREWWKTVWFYISGLIALIFPVLIFLWNKTNNFISFSFHEDRVSLFEGGINFNTLTTEFVGQVLYNNPIIFVLTLVSVIYVIRKNKVKQHYLLLSLSLPLIGLVYYFSLSRGTLPHWVGPAYVTLLPLVGLFLSERFKLTKTILVLTTSMTLIAVVFGFGVINKGWFLPEVKQTEKREWNKNDITLDLYGWRAFRSTYTDWLIANPQYKSSQIISNKWFPAAHIKQYIAEPNNQQLFVLGPGVDIHEYLFINPPLADLKKQALYITNSRNYKEPTNAAIRSVYSKYELIKKFPIHRGEKVVGYYFVFLLKN